MNMNHDVLSKLRDIDSMPYGSTRNAEAEALLRKVETDGPEEYLVQTHITLVQAYTFSDREDLSIPVFARVLRLLDERPELFDEQDLHNTFWAYKWVACALYLYPQISAAQAESFLDDMERRYRLAGMGLAAVDKSRFEWASSTGRGDAEALRNKWRAHPDDELNDCPACVIGAQVEHLTHTGRFEEALELGTTLDSSCITEPSQVRYLMAFAALETGKMDLADKSRREAEAADPEHPDMLQSAHGLLFQVLARGGRVDEAIERLSTVHRHHLTGIKVPLVRLEFFIAILAGLSANLDQGDLPTGLDSAEWATIADLHAWVLAEATPLAEAFDARNENDNYSRRIEAALAATRTTQPLPESMTLSDQALATGIDSDSLSETLAFTGAELFEQAEQLWQSEDYAAAQSAYHNAALRLEEEGFTWQSGHALAEKAACIVADSNNNAKASALFAEALERLRKGDGPRNLIVGICSRWAEIACKAKETRQCQLVLAELISEYTTELEGAKLETTSSTDGSTDDVHLAEKQCQIAMLKYASAVIVFLQNPSPVPAGTDLTSAVDNASTSAKIYARLGLIDQAAWAFRMAGLLQQDQEHHEDAVWSFESAMEAHELTGDQEAFKRTAEDLAVSLNALGRIDEAEKLVEKLRD